MAQAMGAELIVFLSTPSARRATQDDDGNGTLRGISIHALREEGDVVAVGAKLTDRQFLSTPSARRATAFTDVIVKRYINFYPRPPRGGRPA